MTKTSQATATRISTPLRGKNVTSSDPRKAAIVAAFKALTGCTKVTMLKETKAGSFVGSCMRPGRPWEGAGSYELVTEAPAETAKALPAKALKVPTAEMRASSKTHASNHEVEIHRGVFAPSEVAIVDYVNANGSATVKELAAALFGGDYLKAKNAVRRPRWSGLITHGEVRGSYVAVES